MKGQNKDFAVNNEEVSEIRISLADFDAYNWESVLKGAEKPVCSLYSSQLFKKSGELADQGDTRGAKIFRLLGAAASMMLRCDGQNSPFTPAFVSQNQRSAILDDFTAEELDICTELLSSTKDPAMRARLADMVWVSRKNHKAAKIAAEAYLEHFQRLNVSEDWAWDIESIQRGVGLARILGKKDQLFQMYGIFLEKLLKDFATIGNGGPCLRAAEILCEHEIGDTIAIGKIMDLVAERLDNEKEYFIAQRYYEQATRCYTTAKDESAARTSLRKKGESLLRQAEAAVNGPGQGYMTATHFLALGIECLRQAHAPETEIECLHKKLRDWQRLMLREMRSFSYEVDLSKSVEAAIKLVDGKNLFAAIKEFALGHPLLKKQNLTKRVIENARDFPVSHLFAATFLSHDGRVMAQKPPFLAGQDIDEKALDAEIISQAKTVDLRLRVGGFVLPCRDVIWQQHRPAQRDLSFLVEDNPFVPPGHEILFLRGIQAGFQGDMITSAHLLIPQIEESIRHVLRCAGFVTSKLDSKLIQEERLLKVLLAMPETAEIFGEDTVLELRVILADPFGYDLRNRFAHGFLTSSECFGPDVFLTWWWIVRLCAFPVFSRQSDETNGSSLAKK